MMIIIIIMVAPDAEKHVDAIPLDATIVKTVLLYETIVLLFYSTELYSTRLHSIILRYTLFCSALLCFCSLPGEEKDVDAGQ